MTSICSGTFERCSSLTNILIPDSITRIGYGAFLNCRALTSVAIPAGVTSIEASVFGGCSSLTGVTIPDSVTSIGETAFNGCSSLTGIIIPGDVVSIGGNAFSRCNNLHKVVFLIEDENTTISFGSSIFSSSNPTIYCHMYTAPYSQFYGTGYTVVLLENIGLDDIRDVSLPGDFRLACGDSRQLTATVFPNDGSAVAWTSSDPGVLTVADGLVTAVAPGSATVTAAVGAASASVQVEVYLPATGFELSAAEVWEVASNPVLLSVASIEPAGATAEITWSVSDATLARVDANGRVITLKYGEVTVTATTERGVSRSCQLHLYRPVTAVALTAPKPVLIAGYEMQLTALVTAGDRTCENHLVTFASSDESVAAVDSETGLVRGVAPGTATITAVSSTNKSAAVEVQVVSKDGLTHPAFPAGLTRIEDEAFAGTDFQAFFIPDTVTFIGSGAFDGCPNLLYICVPAEVEFAEDAFAGCENAIIDRGE